MAPDPDVPTPSSAPPSPRPVGFARHGAGRREAPSTRSAFELATRLGATGLASTVWATADGQAVVSATGTVGGRLRHRAIVAVPAGELPDAVVTLVDLVALAGSRLHVALDVGDPAVVAEAVAVARDAEAEDRLWLIHDDAELLASWRPLSPAVRLVQASRLRAMKEGPERRAADLRVASVDGVRLPHSDWTAGLATLFHRFDRLALAADAQFPRTVAEAVRADVDAIFSDDPELVADL
jgi:hypothetical protein